MSQVVPVVDLSFPDKLQCLFLPKRYKVLYGGRGGAKSWGIARALLILARQKTLRILCAREYQNSIKESVHKLLSDQIEAMGLAGEYEILQAEIRHRLTGSLFMFKGIRHNVQEIKSTEGVDICWLEEAQSVTGESWDILIPTIRKEASEIWISFNPNLSTDETYKRFILEKNDDAFIVKISWRDNPWFPEVLKKEKDKLKLKDPDAYLHVWEGECKKSLDGAVYAQELRDAREEGRILRVPYDHTKPVHTFWDLGHSDSTAIWMVQVVGFEYRVIDFYQNSMQKLDHYVKTLGKKRYVWGTDWLPHDAKAQQLGSKKTIEEMLRGYGRTVRIVPKAKIFDGINAARTVFSNCYFDENNCKAGLDALFNYKYVKNSETGLFSKEPVHDWSSHAADAFRYFAMAIVKPQDKKKPTVVEEVMSFAGFGNNQGWMK
jgi:phage terminase large subunit